MSVTKKLVTQRGDSMDYIALYLHCSYFLTKNNPKNVIVISTINGLLRIKLIQSRNPRLRPSSVPSEKSFCWAFRFLLEASSKAVATPWAAVVPSSVVVAKLFQIDNKKSFQNLTPRFPLHQIDAFRLLRRHCAKLRDRRMALIVLKGGATALLSYVQTEISIKPHVLAQFKKK